MRRIENVERLLAERPPDHLGRERRAAHPEQHDCIDLIRDGVRELHEQVDVLAHAPWLIEPAEPLRLVGARPQRRVAPPDPLDDLGVRHAAASAPRFARTSSMIWSNESANFCTPSASIVSTTPS
jgi:hypothetical protein